NGRLPAGARFSGIKYDVEPQTLEEWRRGGAVREKVMRDYLQCLACIQQTLATNASKGGRMPLATGIPFWGSNPELKMEYGGRTQLFSEHVQDLTDSVTLMSYRRDIPEVIRLVEAERAYAARTGKAVLPALLHSKAADPNEARLSFYGLSN